MSRGRCAASASTSGAGSSARSADRKLWSSSTSPSSRTHTSMETVPGSMPATRGPGVDSDDLSGHGVDAISVEHEVVALKEPAYAGLVRLHLLAADGQRAEDKLPLPLDEIVPGLDTLDPERLSGVVVGQQLNRWTAAPHLHRGVTGGAREEGSLHEVAHSLRGHASVAEQNVDPGVLGDDRVERARMLIGVE